MKCPNDTCGREMRIVRHKLWADIYYFRCDNCKARVYDSLETVKSLSDRMRGMSDLSEQEKAIFKSAGERRKERGIVLRKFSFMAESNQVFALNELLDSWIQRFGKEQAIDHLIVLWGRVEARLRDKERAKES
jgi:hypothetical protein